MNAQSTSGAARSYPSPPEAPSHGGPSPGTSGRAAAEMGADRASAYSSTGAGASRGPTPGDVFRDAARKVGEVGNYASYFLATKIDSIKIGIRNAGIYAGLGLLGAVAGASLLVTAVVLLLVGLAHGLGALFGDRYWLGDLIVGFLVLAGMTAAVVIAMKKLTGTFRKQTVDKYERRKREQRAAYGRDVHDEAAAAQQADRSAQ